MQEVFKTEEEWLKASEFIECIEQISCWNNKKLIRLYMNIDRDIRDEIIKQVENLNCKIKKKKTKRKSYIKKYSKRYSSSKLVKREGWKCFETLN